MFLDQLTTDVFKRHKSNFTKLSSSQATGNSPQLVTWFESHKYHLLPSGFVETTDTGFHGIVSA